MGEFVQAFRAAVRVPAKGGPVRLCKWESRVKSCNDDCSQVVAPAARVPSGCHAAIGLFATLTILPVPALAACLTQADLAKGLRATYLDGSVIDYQAEGDDMVQVTETPDLKAPQAVRFQSRFGIYDLSAQGLVDGLPQAGQVLEYSYSDAAGNTPPRPAPGAIWLGQSTTTYVDGTSNSAVAVMVFGTEGKVRLGECDYAVIPVTASYLAGESWTAQDFDWLSDLGIGLLTRREGSEAARASAYRVTGLARRLP